MAEPPLISVCIANYNGIGMIDECIDSVLSQEGRLPCEILVHDDASCDGSVMHIRARYPQVRVLESRTNVGFCVANNRMAAAARGRYLLLLNNDAALFPDALMTLHRAAESLGRAAILGLPQHAWDSGILVDKGMLFDPFLNAVPNVDLRRVEVGMVAGACLWIPKRLWDELGGFPEWFGSIAEDMYLCLRARLWGYPVRVLHKSGFRHRIGSSFGGGKVTGGRLLSTYARRALSERNKTFVMVICYPGPALWFLLPLHLGLLMLEGIMLGLLRKDRKVWRAIYGHALTSLWHSRRMLWANRIETQNKRRVGASRLARVFVPVPYKLTLLARFGIPEIGDGPGPRSTHDTS